MCMTVAQGDGKLDTAALLEGCQDVAMKQTRSSWMQQVCWRCMMVRMMQQTQRWLQLICWRVMKMKQRTAGCSKPAGGW